MAVADQPATADQPTSAEFTVVRAEGIVKRFGPTLALDRAQLAVRPGEAHALVGRNGAGKSTLVSVLTGMERPDEGTVTFSDEPAPGYGDTAAWQRKVACVYQKSMVVPDLTVAENLYLGRFQGTSRIRWRALREDARALLAEYGVDVDPQTRAKDLTVEQGQFVEIARALSFGARLIILDEPTAQLDAGGIERLFSKLRELRRQGVAFLFISHHLQEVYELCDTVTVFRDARHVVTAPVAELPKDELVAAMTGDAEAGPPKGVRGAVPAAVPREEAGPGAEPVLRTEGLSRAGEFDPLDLVVRPGEVVGLAGATASGNTAVGETLVGLRKQDGGRVVVRGRAVRPGSVPHAIDAGIGYVPEDRHRQGLVLGRSVAENATLTVTDQLGPFGTVLPSRTRAFAGRMIASLDIKTSGPGQVVSGLSGGNQQKVVIARALAREPSVLVAIRPTAGVDVKSKDALLGVVREVAAAGSGALIVSDELDDLRVCDRVLAFFHGRVVAEFGSDWSDRGLVAAMEGMAGPETEHGAAEAAAGPAGEGRNGAFKGREGSQS
ncbi:putative ABC transporter ATP-binding protein [Streptomyces bingchenggensis BCW-1]|uniref:Putative ABC transporter ATP-binding protein n=1 Tax=Streptomyces bingchenggensis (strain BCW-1) TaxID=749414 RepID=D7BSS9_STRBB|nr:MULTISPECIES: sugar ABC transporter ATP-binding protein [Streptomyces]ADI11576.1 putative ABC transporter ATP-binding protein [Streptomyces bingchenggensis BCW-1]